jgi:hypothetical protein
VQLITSPLVTPQQEPDVFSLPKIVPFNKVQSAVSLQPAHHPAYLPLQTFAHMQCIAFDDRLLWVRGRVTSFLNSRTDCLCRLCLVTGR